MIVFRKMIFSSISTKKRRLKIQKNDLSNFLNASKGIQGSLGHEIDVEKYFQIGFRRKNGMSKKFQQFWSSFLNVQKWAQEIINDEIDAEKWFSDRYLFRQLTNV